jgi:hypothetical protein
VLPAVAEVLTMTVTCGPLFAGSWPSVDLSASLGNRLRAKLDVHGCPEYVLTWRRWDMDAGPPICALRASGRRTSGKDSFGWQTPAASDGERSGVITPNMTGQSLTQMSRAAGWPTPQVCTGPNMSENRGKDHGGRRGRQTEQSVEGIMDGWPTPRTITGGGESAERKKELGREKAGGGDLQAAALTAGWSSPTQTDANKRGKVAPRPGAMGLSEQVPLTGPEPNGTNAETGSKDAYRLNPRFSLWLQGYPVEWACCGERAMRLIRLSRRRSSKRTLKSEDKP